MNFYKNIIIVLFLLILNSCATKPISNYKYDVPIEQFKKLNVGGSIYDVGFIYNISDRPRYKGCLESQKIVSRSKKNEWIKGGNLKNKYSERVCIDHKKSLILVIFDAWYESSVTPVGKEFITCSNVYGKNSGRGFDLIEGDFRPRSSGLNNKYIYHHCTSFFLEEVALSKGANIISNIGSLGLNYALGNNPVFLKFSHQKVVDAVMLSTVFETTKKSFNQSILMKLKRDLIALKYFNGTVNGSYSKTFIDSIEEFLSDEGRSDIMCNKDCSNLFQSKEFLGLIDESLKRVR